MQGGEGIKRRESLSSLLINVWRNSLVPGCMRSNIPLVIIQAILYTTLYPYRGISKTINKCKGKAASCVTMTVTQLLVNTTLAPCILFNHSLSSNDKVPIYVNCI